MTTAAFAFFGISCVSLTVQTVNLVRLLTTGSASQRAAVLANSGLLRTSICRVAVACLYVCLAVFVLSTEDAAGVATLLVFAAAQVTWWANSLLDVRLKHRLRKDHP